LGPPLAPASARLRVSLRRSTPAAHLSRSTHLAACFLSGLWISIFFSLQSSSFIKLKVKIAKPPLIHLQFVLQSNSGQGLGLRDEIGTERQKSEKTEVE
jgi:hypothetical protein